MLNANNLQEPHRAPPSPNTGARIPRLNGLPRSAGLGLRREHLDDVLSGAARIGFVEIHAENYMSDGGPALDLLDALKALYPISLHGVALSLGGEDPLDLDHLRRLRRLVDRIAPASFSEHLAWSIHDGIYFNDLLPVAYNAAALDRVCDRIDQTQQALGMRLLLENPASYLLQDADAWPEVDFLAEVADRTDCGLLLDLNNVLVSATNQGWDPADYLAAFPVERVGEVHLAGHEDAVDGAGAPVLIDTHGSAVAEGVWGLFETLLPRTGPLPTLIERDNEVPPFEVLLAEVRRADAHLQACVNDGTGS